MELKQKLRALRAARNMTQEAVAERLGVSAQTVSKWERGLLSPDIAMLPKIALLFKCSIDSLFDMELAWSAEHRKKFELKIRELHAAQDWESVYQAWIREIELNPDRYANYPDVMLHVLRKKLFTNEHIGKMISLADHAEKCCTDDDIRNEIYRIMLQICSESDDETIKKKGKSYYKKLPMLRHSREVYARFVMDGEEYRSQMQKNITYLIDLAECTVRQLITPDMPPEEKLFYYQKAADLYEIALDGQYAGFYDPPLLSDYFAIAKLYMKLGQPDKASEYMDRICRVIEKHITDADKRGAPKLISSTSVPNTVAIEKNIKTVLCNILGEPILKPFVDRISDIIRQYMEQYPD